MNNRKSSLQYPSVITARELAEHLHDGMHDIKSLDYTFP